MVRVKLFLLLLISTILYSKDSDIDYSFVLSKKNPYKKEPIILDVNITQKDNSHVMFFKFTPKKSSSYEFKQIYFREDEKYHALKHEYRYIIYPLKSKNISIKFNMVKSITTDDSVAYAISGDRDNVKGLVKRDVTIELKPLILNVKDTPIDTELVGDFKLDYSLDKNRTISYEPINLHIELSGEGYLRAFNILKKSSRYNLFFQEPKVTKNSIIWDYAISAKESFVLPKIVLKAFNPQNKKSYNLIVPAQNISVTPIDTKLLLDKRDNPQSINKDIDWSWIGWLLSYIIVFIAGFLTPKDILKRRVRKRDNIENIILSTKSHKELLRVLISQNSKKYEDAILDLESSIYGDKKIPLQKIKRGVLNDR